MKIDDISFNIGMHIVTFEKMNQNAKRLVFDVEKTRDKVESNHGSHIRYITIINTLYSTYYYIFSIINTQHNFVEKRLAEAMYHLSSKNYCSMQ